MIAAPVWNPAMILARGQTRTARFDAAMTGMQGVINDFFTDSYRCWANRTADGLAAIDAAANAVRNNWQAWGGAGVAADASITTLLNACANWLANRRVFGMRVTGWREPYIQKLYWQVAWCYSCDHYVQQALAQIGANNALGNATVPNGPVAAAALSGSPYNFVNCGYFHQPLAPLRVLRGDTRGPNDPTLANGFQPINLANRWAYHPWFDGNAVGDTISVTTDPALAIDAGPAAHALGYVFNPAHMPGWLAAERIRLGVGVVRGYVYELNAGALPSTRLTEAPPGREHIYLALPAATIINWWFVTANPHRCTVGPYPFPAPGAAPGVGVAPGVPATVSAAPHTLA